MNKNYELNVEKRARWYECYVSINEIVHRIYYKTTLDGMFHLYVDDKCVMSKKNWIVKLRGLDYVVEISGKTLHCIFDRDKLDVAMNGEYIKSQNVYVPKKALAKAVTAIFGTEFVTITVIFLYAENKITIPKKELVGLLIFFIILLLLAEKNYDDLYKKGGK